VRLRLRPAWDEEELARFCPHPHNHADYPSHIIRVEHTISLGWALLRAERVKSPSVADLSCGDAVIPRALCDDPVLGDFAPGYPIQGYIERTLGQCPPVDLFVFSETAEHVDDPDGVLARIRRTARLLLLSTPLGEFDDSNLQHYWGWDQDGVREMLQFAGWEPMIWSTVTMPDASFQIWGCR
jgi:hypothetical protein